MSVIVGSVSPVTLSLTVTRAAGSSLDMSTVSAASIKARLPKLSQTSGEAFVELTWAPTIVPINTTSLRLDYALQAGDVDRIGIYGLSVLLTVPSGPLHCLPASLSVIDRF